MNLGYVRSEDLLKKLVKALSEKEQNKALTPFSQETLKEASWHLFRKTPSELTEKDF